MSSWLKIIFFEFFNNYLFDKVCALQCCQQIVFNLLFFIGIAAICHAYTFPIPSYYHTLSSPSIMGSSLVSLCSWPVEIASSSSALASQALQGSSELWRHQYARVELFEYGCCCRVAVAVADDVRPPVWRHLYHQWPISSEKVVFYGYLSLLDVAGDVWHAFFEEWSCVCIEEVSWANRNAIPCKNPQIINFIYIFKISINLIILLFSLFFN